METLFVLLPTGMAMDLSDGVDIFPEDVPDPWVGSHNHNALPEATIGCYKDSLAAKSDRDLTQSMTSQKLVIVQLKVKSDRIMDWPFENFPDPSACLLTMGIRKEDYVSTINENAVP